MTCDVGLDMEVVVEDKRWLTAVPALRKTIDAAVRCAMITAGETGPLEVAIVLMDDAGMRALNYQYCGRDAPTNVLSFANRDACMPMLPNAPEVLGDVILAYERVTEEAVTQEKPTVHHLTHLVVHGMLHLFSFNHLTPDEAARMEPLEKAILKKLGVPDPYTADDLQGVTPAMSLMA